MGILKRLSKQILRFEVLFPIVIFFIAFGLRIYTLNENLFFGWEQGRDALIVQEILSGQKLTLIGPKTDIEGVFHGAFYYYLMTIPYFLGRGNPLAAATFIAFLNSLGASLIFWVGKKRLNQISRVSIALLYSFSFQGIVFSRWLSNPSLVLPLSVILFLIFTEKFRQINFLLAIFFWGLIFHLELASALFLTPVLLYYLFTNLRQIRLSLIIKSGLILFLIFSPYLIFDFRHEHILSKSLLSFSKTAGAEKLNLFVLIKELYRVGLREFNLLIIPKLPIVGKVLLLLGLIIAIWERKKIISKITLVWIFSPLVFLIPSGTIPMSQTLIHLGPAFFVLVGLIIEKIINLTRKKYLGVTVLLLLLVINFSYYSEVISDNKDFFFRAYQYTFIGPQRKIIDFIYKEAEGKQFSFNYYTFPYWLPQGWNYLFATYGQQKYGYLPSSEKSKEFFVIIEPDEVTPKYQEDWHQKLNQESKLLKDFSAGQLKAEKRLTL